MKKEEKIYLSLAFVWFTTHFGGGFASGRQVVQYFVSLGGYAIIMPILSQAILGLVFYAAWRFALEHQAFNYKIWTDKFYKPVEKILSPAYEILYNLILVTATAVAFATGGATLTSVLGTSYLLNTALIGAVLFFLTIFGAKLVRMAATYVAVAIIIGMFVIYIPNIIAGFPQIAANLASFKAAGAEQPSFWSALWTTLTYAGFQSVVLGAYIAHSSALKTRSDVTKASVLGFILNSLMLVMTVLGLLIFLNDGVLTDPVPALIVIRKGVGASWMVPLVSVLIVLGAVSTGVNMIYGITQRIVTYLSRQETPEVAKTQEMKRSIVVSAIYVLITWSVAQFGLIPLVAKGYGTLGYIAIFVIIIPVLLKFFILPLFTGKAAAEKA